MSHTVTRITPQDYAPPAMIDRMRTRVLAVGVVFAVVALGLAVASPNGDVLFLRAWLFSFMFWLGLTTGSLVPADAAIHQRRQLGQAGTPYLGGRSKQSLADVPVLAADCFWDEDLYPWARAG